MKHMMLSQGQPQSTKPPASSVTISSFRQGDSSHLTAYLVSDAVLWLKYHLDMLVTDVAERLYWFTAWAAAGWQRVLSMLMGLLNRVSAAWETASAKTGEMFCQTQATGDTIPITLLTDAPTMAARSGGTTSVGPVAAMSGSCGESARSETESVSSSGLLGLEVAKRGIQAVSVQAIDAAPRLPHMVRGFSHGPIVQKFCYPAFG